jgi:hypothetical protein
LQIRADVRRHIARTTAERQRQARRLKRLCAQSRRLLRAHYADAILLELLREEQARIIREKRG